MLNNDESFCETFLQYVADVIHRVSQHDIERLRNGPSNKFEREVTPNLQKLATVQFTDEQFTALIDLLTGVREDILVWFLRQIDQTPLHLPNCPEELGLVDLDHNKQLCPGQLADSLSFALMVKRELLGKSTYVGLY